uniref:Placental growth factor b n=1 Tax=Pundamilia nyererei TaxID=303518 RepID=A0A3B4HAI2_9CICH
PMLCLKNILQVELISCCVSVRLTQPDGCYTMEQLVLVFEKVWGRSFCRTIEKLVEVVQEYPSEVEHIYSPSCVPLVRCAGCCGDENLECHPTQTTNVTMQLLKIRPSEQGQEYVEMTFVEHQTCEFIDKYEKYKPQNKVVFLKIPAPSTHYLLIEFDSSQVTAVATQPPVAVWLTICFQPSGSIKSLLHSSINTVSAARDSNSWVDLLTCPYADGQGVFVTTRFNRKCVLTGGNTAVTSLKQWTSLGASAM